MTTPAADVRIEPWAEDDLDLLRLINTEEMRKHVGGPEGPEALLVRHRRYLEFPGLGAGQMFRIVTDQGRSKAGSVGYYSRRWHGEQVFEMGWNVLPPFQGRGIAAVAARLAAEHAAATERHTWLHAFPSVDNPASNAVCRRAGFTLAGETEFEYPPGRFMLSNDWRINLTELAAS
ncbi:GNAT family N-acetyltransferase [Kitasatospora acidiphila]|uniref:GNAT family N-acetyltransferase n=1 Tax=Kitasatospora acidiphila TaxID=2567942 RepID=A0A540W1Q1_9ACTN|nr:GNAT family N-acetyltransferase [Kitasatospora acidiphila]TQF02923.1 GNAT family N-acetyltransferase [Kitasatospora acidiphila]